MKYYIFKFGTFGGWCSGKAISPLVEGPGFESSLKKYIFKFGNSNHEGLLVLSLLFSIGAIGQIQVNNIGLAGNPNATRDNYPTIHRCSKLTYVVFLPQLLQTNSDYI